MNPNGLQMRILSFILILFIAAKTDADDVCVDKLTNCRSYGSAACGTYKDWAQTNCAYSCSFCTGTAPTRQCVDNRDDCSKYVADICTSASWRTWAEDNCLKFCGFCSDNNNSTATTVASSSSTVGQTQTVASTSTPTATTPCVDGLNFCKVYSKRACMDATWADKYCRKFCTRC